MFERPILIYSNYCKYSKLFIKHLLEFSELYETFIRINIDITPENNQRPDIFYEIQEILKYKITNVPTIIIQNGEYVLTGKEAFSWLEYQLNELDKVKESSENNNNDSSMLEPFNPLEMGSFSDGYAGISDSLPNSQSFQFLNAPNQSIQTPEETNQNEQYDNSINYSENDYSKFMQQRNNINSHTQYHSSEQRPIAQMTNKPEITHKKNKQNDVDKKYEQLLAEREMMANKKKQPKKVNFASGTFE